MIRNHLGKIVFVSFAVVALALWQLRPIADNSEEPSIVALTVDTEVLVEKPYTTKLTSFGNIQPRIQSSLVAQVTGQIIYFNPNVRSGGFFNEGDVLIQIDPSDYEANVDIANSALMDARQVLAEEEARSIQAKENWTRLGEEGEPPPLVARVPQLNAAKARVESAKAQLRKSELELERTTVRAPFEGRALQKYADVGQVVPTGSALVDIFATDSVEVRLPLRDADLSYVDLPEQNYEGVSTTNRFPATINSELGGTAQWEAELVRTEGAIDTAARQLHVVAQINDPYGEKYESQPALKLMQYVTALIPGKTIPNAIVIPNSSIYQSSYVYVVEDDLLQRREVTINWQNEEVAMIGSGLRQGDELVLTLLGQVYSGTPVSRRATDERITPVPTIEGFFP